ncbi:MAG: hypothetical protein NY202_05620 [Mollicutes bacterium UO1]
MAQRQKSPILFYEAGEEYYEFTNLKTGYPINIALPQITPEGKIIENNEPSQIKE